MEAANPTALEPLVDAVFVVSVRSFTDRVEHMRAEMARFGIRFEWVWNARLRPAT
jgi:hypothetical protein